jgi:hypothetical protein
LSAPAALTAPLDHPPETWTAFPNAKAPGSRTRYVLDLLRNVITIAAFHAKNFWPLGVLRPLEPAVARLL